MKIIAVRHTKVAVESGVCYGFSDVDIASTFNQEATEVMRNLKGYKWNSVCVSPLMRCTKLANKLDEPYTTDARLKELNFGDWEMQRWDAIKDKHLDVWMNNFTTAKCTNGESLVNMVNRVELFLSEQKNTDTILIFAHGGVVRCLHHIIDNVPLFDIFSINIPYGSITIFNR